MIRFSTSTFKQDSSAIGILKSYDDPYKSGALTNIIRHAAFKIFQEP